MRRQQAPHPQTSAESDLVQVMPGGRLRKIASSPGKPATQWCVPELSPDGKTIAYDDVHYLRLVDLDGSNIRVLRHDAAGTLNEPRWSSDGKRIVYYTTSNSPQSTFGGAVHVIDVATGHDRRLTPGTKADASDSSPDWVDDHTIVFTRARGAEDSDLQLMDDNGAHRRDLVTSDDLSETTPQVSPDGKTVVYTAFAFNKVGATRAVLRVATLAGKLVKSIELKNNYDSSPAWSPDGKSVIAASVRSAPAAVRSLSSADTALWLIPLDGGKPQEVSDPPGQASIATANWTDPR